MFAKLPHSRHNAPQYTAWARIQNDARKFDVPKCLERAMGKLYSDIERYLELLEDAVCVVTENAEQICAHYNERCLLRQRGALLVSNICTYKGIEAVASGLFVMPIEKMTDKDMAIANEVMVSSGAMVEISRLIGQFKRWEQSEQDVIDTLALLIKTVTAKHESVGF